jgi:hypothetical protein
MYLRDVTLVAYAAYRTTRPRAFKAAIAEHRR